MYYAQMRKYDIANGPGIRATLFVSGCTHHCPHCFNEPYQDFKYGKLWDEQAETLFMSYAKDPNVHGISILGGEPMQQDETLLKVLKRIKQETNQTIWLYSGYTYEVILQDTFKRALLEQCDVLVDGPFIEQLKNLNLNFRGSSNQRLIDVPASLKAHQVVLYSED